ncbi:MAG: hypothetical protein ACK50Y_10270 [Flavobacteriia bacterium]|jgi:hypothetical protein
MKTKIDLRKFLQKEGPKPIKKYGFDQALSGLGIKLSPRSN